jgi:predicted HicB family RNase H-like nuclease
VIKYDPEKNPFDGTYVSLKDGGNPEYGFHQVWKEGYEQALRDVENQNKEDEIDRMERELEDYMCGINEARDRIAKQNDR